MKDKFSLRKKIIQWVILMIACGALSMVWIRTNDWYLAILIFSAAMAALIAWCWRCPNCGKRIQRDFDGTCTHCGTELEDSSKSENQNDKK